MSASVVVSEAAVTLVGGAPLGPDDLSLCTGRAPRIVAADSGADAVRAAGRVPEAVIGDMDSISAEARAACADVLHPVAEQDSTDFEKCLTRIAAPLVLAAGFAGARLDHALAAFNALVRHPQRRCVMLGATEATALAPPDISFDLAAGTRVSLFPLAQVTGQSTGLHWPIDGIAFAPDGPVGTSNRATGPVRLRMQAPGMLLMLPREALDGLLAGLEAAPRWPAP